MYTVNAELTLIPEPSEQEFGDAVYQTGFDAARLAHDDIEQHLLDDVREYPPSPNRKIEWVSDAQRRWARWAWAQGMLPYVRTYNYQRGWKLSQPQLRNGKIVMSLTNGDLRNYRGDNYFPYVGGGLMPNNTNLYQQAFHKITGWKQVQPLADAWMEVYIKQFREHYKEIIQRKIRALFGAPR